MAFFAFDSTLKIHLLAHYSQLFLVFEENSPRSTRRFWGGTTRKQRWTNDCRWTRKNSRGSWTALRQNRRTSTDVPTASSRRKVLPERQCLPDAQSRSSLPRMPTRAIQRCPETFWTRRQNVVDISISLLPRYRMLLHMASSDIVTRRCLQFILCPSNNKIERWNHAPLGIQVVASLCNMQVMISSAWRWCSRV